MKNLEYKGVVIPILFENEDYVVIDKPEGLIVELTYESEKISLKDIIKEIYNPIASITLEDEKKYKTKTEYNLLDEFKEREGLVHRLDAATSGVMVIAKTVAGFAHLKQQFMDRAVHKKYIAITYDKFAKADINQMIEVNAPIGRSVKNRTKFVILEQGKPALTQLTQKKFLSDEFTLWECIPKTGRTHQIRVHLTSLNCPIVGDTKYSGIVRTRRDKDTFTRLYLHALEIGFKDLSGNFNTYASKLPHEFTDLIEKY